MIKENNFENVKYLLSYPDGFDKSQKYPLVIFLHGAGTVSDTTEILRTNSCFLNICKNQTERGYVVLAPLCHATNWNELMGTLIKLVDSTRQLEFIDIKRVHLTGNSMGGYGTWMLGGLRPDWFASLMPVCGGSMVWHARATLKNVPIRAFHGLRDDDVDPIESLEACKAVNRNGGYAELILFPDLSHNCWDRVYTDERNYDWLLQFTTDREKKQLDSLSGDYYG